MLLCHYDASSLNRTRRKLPECWLVLVCIHFVGLQLVWFLCPKSCCTACLPCAFFKQLWWTWSFLFKTHSLFCPQRHLFPLRVWLSPKRLLIDKSSGGTHNHSGVCPVILFGPRLLLVTEKERTFFPSRFLRVHSDTRSQKENSKGAKALYFIFLSVSQRKFNLEHFYLWLELPTN